MFTKQELIQTLTWESATTAKVLRSFPIDNLEYKPHERCGTVKQLLMTFIAEAILMRGFIDGKMTTNTMESIAPFEKLEDGVKQFEQEYRQLITALQAADDENFTKPYDFFGRQSTRGEAIQGMLFDMIHHRGQYTIYIRINDGNVPSIYGPSGDEGIQA